MTTTADQYRTSFRAGSCDDFGAEWAAVRDVLRRERETVDLLPSSVRRDAGESARAAQAHAMGRRARRRFLARHAGTVHAELTDGHRHALGFDEIAAAAVDVFPGLLPEPAQMAADAALPQREKEGWEIDQGLFFHALLDDDVAGPHLLRAMLRPTPAALDRQAEFARTGHVDTGLCRVTRTDGISIVEFANLRYLNAEDDDAVAGLETCTDLVLLDPATHVGVLRGAPMTHPSYTGRRVFNAGINLTTLFDGGISLLGFLLRREAGYISKFTRGLAVDDELAGGPADGSCGDRWWPAADKPWVAAVDSFAVGGGMQILPQFDRVVAAEDSWFSLPALDEGLVPGLANLRMPRVLGARLARDFIVGGRRATAGSPEGRLLVDDAVPAEHVDAAVLTAAQRLDNPAVLANRRMVHFGEEPPELFRRYLARYALEQAYRLYSPDLVEKLERTWIQRRERRAAAGRAG